MIRRPCSFMTSAMYGRSFTSPVSGQLRESFCRESGGHQFARNWFWQGGMGLLSGGASLWLYRNYLRRNDHLSEGVSFESERRIIAEKSSSALGEEKGVLKVNLPSLIQTMGASMYGVSIAETAVKELLQNAFDAVKEAEYLGLIKEGDIQISFDAMNRTITVKDNGIGMTPEIVRDAFFTIAGSHKGIPSHLRSGGYGQAKIAFLMNVAEINLRTTRNGETTEVTTTPSELLSNSFKISRFSASEAEHGTTVTVRIPETCVVNGEEKSVYFFHTGNYYKALTAPLIGNVKITVNDGWRSTVLSSGVHFNKSVHSILEFSWGTATIYASPPSGYSPSHSVLASGVIQFNPRFTISDTTYEQIPLDLIIDIKSKVSPDDQAYPFTNNRQEFRKSAGQDIQTLKEWLRWINGQKEREEWKQVFRGAWWMPRLSEEDLTVASGTLEIDSTKKRRKISRPFQVESGMAFIEKEFNRHLRLRSLQNPQKKLPEQREAINEWEPVLGNFASEELEAPRTIRAEDVPAMIAKSNDGVFTHFPSNRTLFINNTNSDVPLNKEVQELFAGVASLFCEMKNAVASSGLPGYDHRLTQSYAGVLIDCKVSGLCVPYLVPCVLVNPLGYSSATNIEAIRRSILDTMIHEIAHTNQSGRDHGEKHNLAMKDILIYLSNENRLSPIETKLHQLLEKHKNLLFGLRTQHSVAENRGEMVGIA